MGDGRPAGRQVIRSPRFFLVLTALLAAACATTHAVVETDPAQVDAAATLPPGADGALIGYGREIIADTPKSAGRYITARMSCAACHPGAGTQAHRGSLLGVYAKFPQWNKRAHRFIALQDRLAECFLYSMNGRPPPYDSREMIAMTAYIAWLSRGARVGDGFPDQALLKTAPPSAPSAARGAAVYAASCLRCHGANGQGAGTVIPPLWGAYSFNDRAGMAHIDRMGPFVLAAMPQDKPGSLSAQQAFDVAAWVLAHSRPRFDPKRLIGYPAQPAGFF